MLRLPSLVTGGLGLALVVGGAGVWLLTSVDKRPSAPSTEVVIKRVEKAAPPLDDLMPIDPVLAMRTGDPLKRYFGIPVNGHVVGFVVDGDATMAPYINSIAAITNAVNKAPLSSPRKYGVVQAFSEDGRNLVEVVEPSSDLQGARSVLGARLASGATNLPKALGVTTNWYADQLFLVLSKHLTPAELEVLTQNAEQTGAEVNVIAVGQAAGQSELAGIASATGGRFVPVDDSLLGLLVERQREAPPAAQRPVS